MPEIIELTKSSAASLDCLSYMIELRRKNILKAESFLMQHRDSLSPERIAQIEQDLEDMRSGLHNMETDYCSIAVNGKIVSKNREENVKSNNRFASLFTGFCNGSVRMDNTGTSPNNSSCS